MTIALAIPNTPWVPERADSLARLLASLGIDDSRDAPFMGPVRVFPDREPNWVWSERIWRWALETGADYLLQLQDDVMVAPNFWPALRAMLEAVPDKVIGLEAAHPAAKRLALEGHRWYTTADMLIGPGYVMPRAELEEFVRWRRFSLRPQAVEAIPEDTLIGMWAVASARKLWHPIPTIIDHDTTLPSVYGNDAHKYRHPSVTWKDGDVLGFSPEALAQAAWWESGFGDFEDSGPTESGRCPTHLGRFYQTTPYLARMWCRDNGAIRGALEGAVLASIEDVCPQPYARWFR